MSRTPRDRGDWVTLFGGVRVSRRWMTRHTPQLLTAWCDAPTAQQRRTVAALILQVAAELESEPDDTAEALDDRTWQPVAERIDARLVHRPDWLPLAAALARAGACGYDVSSRLPALAAAAPLPERHPARELHWRLLEDCPAALPAPPNADGAAFPADTHNPTGCPQPRRGIPPARHSAPGSTHRSPVPKETSHDRRCGHRPD